MHFDQLWHLERYHYWRELDTLLDQSDWSGEEYPLPFPRWAYWLMGQVVLRASPEGLALPCLGCHPNIANRRDHHHTWDRDKPRKGVDRDQDGRSPVHNTALSAGCRPEAHWMWENDQRQYRPWYGLGYASMSQPRLCRDESNRLKTGETKCARHGQLCVPIEKEKPAFRAIFLGWHSSCVPNGQWRKTRRSEAFVFWWDKRGTCAPLFSSEIQPNCSPIDDQLQRPTRWNCCQWVTIWPKASSIGSSIGLEVVKGQENGISW